MIEETGLNFINSKQQKQLSRHFLKNVITGKKLRIKVIVNVFLAELRTFNGSCSLEQLRIAATELNFHCANTKGSLNYVVRKLCENT